MAGLLPSYPGGGSMLSYRGKKVVKWLRLPVYFWGFPGGSVVKNLPAMQEMRVLPLGGEDPLEKEMATHSSILA